MWVVVVVFLIKLWGCSGVGGGDGDCDKVWGDVMVVVVVLVIKLGGCSGVGGGGVVIIMK